jgi:hypothetical protein
MKNEVKNELIKNLTHAMRLYSSEDMFTEANTIKKMIAALEIDCFDEFNFNDNNGQVNISRGNGCVNAEQTIVKKFNL